MGRLRSKKIVVRERSLPAGEVRFREVGRPRVVRWYMTDEERLEEARRVDGVEMVPLGVSGATRSHLQRRKWSGVVFGAIRWLRG